MLRWTLARLATAALAAPALALRATIRSPAELLRAARVRSCALVVFVFRWWIGEDQ
jgi:hypothetical protein